MVYNLLFMIQKKTMTSHSVDCEYNTLNNTLIEYTTCTQTHTWIESHIFLRTTHLTPLMKSGT